MYQDQIGVNSLQQKFTRKTLILKDQTGSIYLNLWGNFAAESFEENKIVLLENVKVQEFMNKKSIQTIFNSKIVFDCEPHPEYESLKSIVIDQSQQFNIQNSQSIRSQQLDMIHHGLHLECSMEGTITSFEIKQLYYDSCLSCKRK